MGRVTPLQSNFNAGELSARLHARPDLNIYDIGCAALVSWCPLIEGGIDACPGTIVVAQEPAPFVPVPFRYSDTQEYVVAMREGKARFYTNDARIEDGGGDPIEIDLPAGWTIDVIRALSWEQSFDVLYLFHPAFQPRTLTRTGADTFALDVLALENGPFETRNTDKSIKVQASGVTGTVTVTASQDGEAYDLFEAGDVGGLFRIEAADFGDIPAWEPGITVAAGALRTWAERVYRKVGGAERTGTLAPTHGSGTQWDGSGSGTDVNDNAAGGVQWEYLHDRYGVLRITAFTSGSQVEALVLRRLPFSTANAGGGYGE